MRATTIQLQFLQKRRSLSYAELSVSSARPFFIGIGDVCIRKPHICQISILGKTNTSTPSLSSTHKAVDGFLRIGGDGVVMRRRPRQVLLMRL